jgi:tetratricopeptide (TPR) repeat protein
MVHAVVSTSSSESQAFYDQGLAYLSSYVWIEAARSFNQSLRHDPDLALAYIGLSYAYAELNNSDAARAAVEHAVELSAKSSARERCYIEIRKAQMAAEASPHDGAKLAVYRKAIDESLAKFPEDEQLWVQRGIAESPDPADRGQGSPLSAQRFYERALQLKADYFPAHHYLIHLFENAGQIDKALKEAAAYKELAPAVPHARHMYAHELRRVGRTDEAVAEFEAADRIETAYLKSENISAEFDWHYQHNLDLLAVGYQYLGQMQKAEERMKRSFAMSSNLIVEEFNKREWPAFLLSRGRASETLDAAKLMIEHSSPLIRATGHIYAGHAYLALHQFQTAAAEANAALHELNSASDGGALVAPSLQQLQGEFFLRTGQTAKAHALLDEFIKKMRVVGPDEWSQALFALESIERAARESGDWEYAARVARQMIEHDSAYAGSHYALGLAADHAGDRNTALAEFTLAEKFWMKADSNMIEIKDVRTRLGH